MSRYSVALLDALPLAGAEWEAMRRATSESPAAFTEQVRKAEEDAFIALFGVASNDIQSGTNGTI